MHTNILQFIRWIGHWIFHLKRMPMLFDGMNSPSYSEPSVHTKNKVSVILDHLYLYFVRGMLPRNYRLWQFDVKPRKMFKEYMDEPDSPFLRRRLYSTLWDDDYSMLVNDKYIFHCYCRHHQLPTPHLYGIMRDGRFFSRPSGYGGLLAQQPNDTQLVVKPARGTQGVGIRFMPASELTTAFNNGKNNGAVQFGEGFSVEEFVVEAFIQQHSEMQRINPHSVNTIRVITLLTRQQDVVPLAGILRTSSSKLGTDNFSTGGIIIGIDLTTGRLNPRGFLKPELGSTLTEHPLTHLRFEDFQIPFWPQVLKLLDSAQKCFHHLYCIGWDIAISADGPILIEGNVEWGTAGIQAATGGLLTGQNRALFAQYGLHFK